MITVFQFECQEVRLVDLNGEVWFVGKDIAKILGYANLSQVIQLHCDKEDSISDIELRKRLKEMSQSNFQIVARAIYINESGLYSLIFGSTKEEARRFKRWVTSEVLPQIRKTGNYTLLSSTEKATKIKDFNEIIDSIFQSLPHIKQELVAGVKLNAAKKLMPEVSDHLEEARQLLINATATEAKLMTVTELGKLKKLSGQAMNKLLVDKGFQVKNINKKSQKDPSYLPTDKAKDHCSFVLATAANSKDTFSQLRWYDSILQLL